MKLKDYYLVISFPHILISNNFLLLKLINCVDSLDLPHTYTRANI